MTTTYAAPFSKLQIEQLLEVAKYRWSLQARPAQRLPLGDWRYWLIKAGRGFGKSRAGAETVREWAKHYRYVNLIGATADDARDIMIEGESGILAICPRWERPTHKRSDRQLLWPSGAKSLIFTADEPDRLRGKQHEKLWGDEIACLVAGTPVTTEIGDVPIERVLAGMFVHTRKGLRRVQAAWCSSASAEVFRLSLADGRSLVGTGNHPVWVDGRGFCPLATLKVGEEVCLLSASNGEGVAGGSTPIRAAITVTARDSFSIVLCMNQFMARFRRAWKSIIGTVIGRITIQPISLPLHGRSMCASTCLAGSVQWGRMKCVLVPCASGGSVSPAQSSATIVAESFTAPECGPNSVIPTADRRTCVAGVEKLAARQPVFNLSVEDGQEYYANGVLVHNSWRYAEDAWDQALFGLRLGDNPQVVVTTTPRPIKIIKDLMADPHTVVTGGSTYENRANLTPAFLDKIVAKYEGTRLGRQELLAEILDDVPGALWTLAQIETLRVAKAPEMRRVVVGVDPSVTTRGNEAGIIVAGLSVDGHGYVLADDSLQASPHGWGSRVVQSYHAQNADRVVAETNNGGEMVELTVRTVDPNVSYKAVHASRGKRTRAEPVAALYEQGKVHHVGVLPRLEDEMTTWTPDDRDSPNRMDAMVWALTELMLVEQPSSRATVALAERVEISPY